MTMLLTAALAASILTNSAPAQAAKDPCDPPGAEAREYWQLWARVVAAAGCAAAKERSDGPFSFPACMDQAEKYTAAIKQMLKTLKQGRDDSRADGPRHIDFNDSQRARAVGTDGPIFRSAAPMRTDGIDVTLSPTAGSGKVEILLCKESPKGERSKLGQIVLDITKDKHGKIESRYFKGVKNHVIRARIQGASKDTKAELSVLFEAREAPSK